MVYEMMYDLERFKSPVIISYNENETRYEDGAAAKANAKFSKPVTVSEVQARNNEIVVLVEENTKYLDTSWSKDKDVSFF